MIFDADGQLINSSGTWPLPDSQRLRARLFPDASRPIRRRRRGADRAGAQRLHRRLDHRDRPPADARPDGTFLGVMARRIDPANYEKFFASVALGPGAAISMFHGDGTMLARYPHVEEMIGKKFKSAPLMQARAGRGRPADAAGEEPGRQPGPARRGRDADRISRSSSSRPTPSRPHSPTGARRPASWSSAAALSAVGDRLHPVPDRPADQPAERGRAAAAGRGESSGSTPR